jgi:shikimate kinase
MRVHDQELSKVYESDGCQLAPIEGTRFSGVRVDGAWRVLDTVIGVSESVESFAAKDAALSNALLEIIADATVLDEGIDDKHILKAIFMCGSGGSGKTSMATAAFGGEGLKVINLDHHFEKMLTQAGIPLSQCSKHGDLYQDAAWMRDKEKRHYSNQRLGLLIDSTGKDALAVTNAVSALEERGYDCYMLFVSTSLDKALARNEKRAQEGGRNVAPVALEKAWKQANANIPTFKSLFGPRFFQFDNDEDLSKEDFQKVLTPKLLKIGNKILSAPLQNPIGKAWIKSQTN